MTITQKLGLQENYTDEYSNTFWTTLTVDGESVDFDNTKPVHACGVHALVEFEGKLHLMSEDDGHFWTHTILTEEDIVELKQVVDQLISELSFGKGYKVNPKIRSRFQWTRQHPKFPSTVMEREHSPAPIVTFIINGKELAMDAGWLKSLSQVLDIH